MQEMRRHWPQHEAREQIHGTAPRNTVGASTGHSIDLPRHHNGETARCVTRVDSSRHAVRSSEAWHAGQRTATAIAANGGTAQRSQRRSGKLSAPATIAPRNAMSPASEPVVRHERKPAARTRRRPVAPEQGETAVRGPERSKLSPMRCFIVQSPCCFDVSPVAPGHVVFISDRLKPYEHQRKGRCRPPTVNVQRLDVQHTAVGPVVRRMASTSEIGAAQCSSGTSRCGSLVTAP